MGQVGSGQKLSKYLRVTGNTGNKVYLVQVGSRVGSHGSGNDPQHPYSEAIFKFWTLWHVPYIKMVSQFQGTCYASSECTSKGGSASGNCASGFGVCCSFK